MDIRGKFNGSKSLDSLVPGELVGGVDIMSQMDEDGSLKTLFEEAAESGKAK